MTAPYVSYVSRNPNVRLDTATFPGNLPFVDRLHLDFDNAVTFLVGENGSGKSTLLEAIAVLSGYPLSGGGTNDAASSHGLNEDSLLANSLWLAFARRPKDGYFFRADLQAHFASLLDDRKSDPHFLLPGGVPADPYARYGGRSLHAKSHGEAFLDLMQNRFSQGLFLLDEPESALSPQRQLTLLALMHNMVSNGMTQFIVATHSAILLTYPGARIVSFDHPQLKSVTLADTSHYQITKRILHHPDSYWNHLRTPNV